MRIFLLLQAYRKFNFIKFEASTANLKIIKNRMAHHNPNANVLCVAEKHDAAKNIAKLLSNNAANAVRGKGDTWNYHFKGKLFNRDMNFVFASVRGHVMNYDFHPRHKPWVDRQIYDLFDGEITQSLIQSKYVQDIDKNLRFEARRANFLLIWTDCDREGENIGAEIVKICLKEKRTLQVYRARFSEITKTAVEQALRELIALDENTVKAVDCRMELDLRIGAAFTRLQTLYFKKHGLQHHLPNNVAKELKVISYGSCQFPTLGFVVERYKENRDFIRQEYWKLTGVDAITRVQFHWEQEGLSVQIFDKAIAEAFRDACNHSTQPATVREVTQKPKSKWRPVPLDTIQLERLGGRFLRMSARQILSVAEKLYQNGYISYPRTETTCYSPGFNLAQIVDALAHNPDWTQFAQEIQQGGGPKPRNGNKNDQAHPPIHPVKCAVRNEFRSADEWRVYEFICKHFLASVSRDATGKETRVKVELGEEFFVTTGLVIEDMGYLKIYTYENWYNKNIPPYRQGQVLASFSVNTSSHFTEPPPLLTESDLIALMDKKGIGTDATHAEHIETIKKRWYVFVRTDRRFEPTKLGLALVDAYERMQHRHAVSKPVLRAALEKDLVKICEGTKRKEAVLQEQLKIYKEIYRSTEIKVHLIGQSFQGQQQ